MAHPIFSEEHDLIRAQLARFVDELAAGAGLNVHIRVLEGRDPEHVLRALFKALGAAIGQACRSPDGGRA